ncbi:MAG: hypothetical protein ACYCXF_07385 [Thermoleophilia bacterium]
MNASTDLPTFCQPKLRTGLCVISVDTKDRFPPAVEFSGMKKCLKQGISNGQNDGGGGAAVFEL